MVAGGGAERLGFFEVAHARFGDRGRTLIVDRHRINDLLELLTLLRMRQHAGAIGTQAGLSMDSCMVNTSQKFAPRRVSSVPGRQL
jgi:hypothetical protein